MNCLICLVYFLPCKQPRPEGGSDQESTLLRAGHLFVGALCSAEAPRHGWQTSSNSDKHLQTTWFGRKSHAARRARFSLQGTLWPAYLLHSHRSALIPSPPLPLPMAQRMPPAPAGVGWGTGAAHPAHLTSGRCPRDAGVGLPAARHLLLTPSRHTRSQ